MGATRFKPHQTAGFNWLLSAWRAGWPGVLLADDMGLGKTFQALAFLAWVREEICPDRAILIVAVVVAIIGRGAAVSAAALPAPIRPASPAWPLPAPFMEIVTRVPSLSWI